MPCNCHLRKKILKSKLELNNTEIYLDYCSTTKPDIRVLSEAERISRIYWGNPSSQHTRGVKLYDYINLNSQEILKRAGIGNNGKFYFSSSSSEIPYIIKENNNVKIITSTIEHKSLLLSGDIFLPVNNKGRIILEGLNQIDSVNCIFIYSPVNHETGSIQNIREIYNFCVEKNIPIILDCVQTISRVEIASWLPYCNGFYFSGHKIHGIPGSAAFILKDNIINLETQDTNDFSLNKGTFNYIGATALLRATELLFLNIKKNLGYLQVLHREAIEILKSVKTEIIINSPMDSVPGIINISIPVIKNMEDFLLHLNTDNIYISRFSACQGDITDSSQILELLGSTKEAALTSLRISFGKNSKRGDFFALVNSINNYLGL